MNLKISSNKFIGFCLIYSYIPCRQAYFLVYFHVAVMWRLGDKKIGLEFVEISNLILAKFGMIHAPL